MTPNRDRRSDQARKSVAKNEKISLYIYDKYAVKYTADQLELILRRSKASGQQSAVAVWILFILFAIFVDFLRLNTFVTSQETYHVEAVIDGGLVSNFSIGKFGWPIILLAVSCISALLIEGITSDNYLLVAAASATFLSVEIGTIIACMALNTTSTSEGDDRATLRWDLFGSLNLAVGCTMCLAWIIWHSIELILLIHGTKRVHSIDMNENKTLLSRQRIKVVNASRPGTKSNSSRRRKRRHAAKAVSSKSSLSHRPKSKSNSKKSQVHKSAPTLGLSGSKISKSRATLSKKSLPRANASKVSLSDATGSKISGQELPSSKISLQLIHKSKLSKMR